MLWSAGILGAGQCFSKMLPGLRRHFRLGAIYDPDDKAVGLRYLELGERDTLVFSEDELFARLPDLDVLFILSPPAEHVRQLERASALGRPVFVEKPLAVDSSELKALEAALARNPSVYFSDFYADVRSAALMKLLRSHSHDWDWIQPFLFPQEEALVLDKIGGLFGEIRSLRARILEPSPDGLKALPRKWLSDRRQGGVLLDLAYHCLVLVSVLCCDSVEITESILGKHGPGQSGPLYDMWFASHTEAETYALLRLRAASGVVCEIEVSNCWNHEARELSIECSKGEVLMNYGTSQQKKNVLSFHLWGTPYAVELGPNYWDLVTLGFHHYLASRRDKPHGLVEGRRALNLIWEARARLSARHDPNYTCGVE